MWCTRRIKPSSDQLNCTVNRSYSVVKFCFYLCGYFITNNINSTVFTWAFVLYPLSTVYFSSTSSFVLSIIMRPKAVTLCSETIFHILSLLFLPSPIKVPFKILNNNYVKILKHIWKPIAWVGGLQLTFPEVDCIQFTFWPLQVIHMELLTVNSYSLKGLVLIQHQFLFT